MAYKMEDKSFGKNRVFIYVLIFIFFISVFILFSNGRYGGDGFENYLTAESMVLDGDRVIYDRPFGVKEMEYAIRSERDSSGKIYSPHGIGMPILLIPFYALGHIISKIFPQIPHDYVTQVFVSLVNPIITALIALILFVFLQRLGFSLRTSFITTLCYGFCTMSLIYTRSGFSEPAVTLFVLLAILFLYRYEESSLARYILLTGFFMGYALLIKKSSFLYLPLVFFYLIYKGILLKSFRSFAKLAFLILFPLLGCIVLFLIFRPTMVAERIAATGLSLKMILRYGGSYGHQSIKALYYYLLSPGKGYFFYNIPLLLAILGIRDLWHRKREISLYLAFFIAINIIYYTYHFTRGSLFSWGPRYLYPTVPIMCIFLAGFIENARSLLKKFILAILSLMGFLVQLPCLFISFTKYLFFVKNELGLQEYLMNFMPELSPILGSWYLFISALQRTFFKVSLTFEYNPDYMFVEPITKSLAKYDIWDIWWVHVMKISAQLLPIVAIMVFCLGTVVIVSFLKLKNSVFKIQR